MPLLPGRSNVSANISELVHSGRKRDQAVAIALDHARRHPRADGGNVAAALRIAHLDLGGTPAPSYTQRREMGDIQEKPYGLLTGNGMGRSDKNNLAVGAGSYVLPADVVAGMGDGHTQGGAQMWDKMLNGMPWGITPPRSAGRRGPPSPPSDASMMAGVTGQRRPGLGDIGSASGRADGGEAEDEDVPIAAADGEIIASPLDVLRVGQHYSPPEDIARYPQTHDRIMKRGHSLLDAFVKEIRGRTIKHLEELEGPVGSRNSSVGHTRA